MCSVCPNGYFCSNTSEAPIECPNGYYSLGGATECTPCPAGHYCPTSSALPILCDQGTFSAGLASTCSLCTAGQFCMDGSTSNSSSMNICPLGSYCPDGATKLKCPAGTFGNRTGLTDALQCSLCPPGFYCPEGTVGYPGADLECPTGHYCLQMTSSKFEYPCPDGTYSITLGLHREDQCLICQPGKYCTGGDGSGGKVCPSGHFCPENIGNPLPCPGGTYTEQSGSEDLSYCMLCPAGFYCPTGTSHPLPCSAGTYNPLLGQDSNDDCQLCRAGTACTLIALTQPNELCAAGHFCPEGSDKSADPDNQCPAGTFTDYHNLTSARECSLCPAGEACLIGTGGISSPRRLCALGHFCPNKTQYPTQYPCAPGTYGSGSNLQRQEDCTICPAGYYCIGGESSPSGPCDPGHYCPSGMLKVS